MLQKPCPHPTMPTLLPIPPCLPSSPSHHAYLPPHPGRGAWGWCLDPGWFPPSPGKTTGPWQAAGTRPAPRRCRGCGGVAGDCCTPSCCLGARLPRMGVLGSSPSPAPSGPAAPARRPLLSAAPTRPWPAPHPHPTGRIRRGLSTHAARPPSALPAQGEQGSGNHRKGARARRRCQNGCEGGLGRRSCLEMGSKVSGGGGWLRTEGIGCRSSLRSVLLLVSGGRRYWSPAASVQAPCPKVHLKGLGSHWFHQSHSQLGGYSPL